MQTTYIDVQEAEKLNNEHFLSCPACKTFSKCEKGKSLLRDLEEKRVAVRSKEIEEMREKKTPTGDEYKAATSVLARLDMSMEQAVRDYNIDKKRVRDLVVTFILSEMLSGLEMRLLEKL